MTNEEMIERIRSLANSILNTLDAHDAQTPPAPEPAAVEKPKAEKKAKPLTLEDVRAKLTSLAGNRGGALVKALLKDFGAEKLSDIAAQDYPELLAKAEELAND